MTLSIWIAEDIKIQSIFNMNSLSNFPFCSITSPSVYVVVVVQSPNPVWLFVTHGLQHARPPCPSPSPKVCPSLCLLHQSCHPAISSSDDLLPFCPQSFSASGTSPMNQLFASNDSNTGASASTSVLPMIQGWFPLRLAGLISLLSKRLSEVFSSLWITVQRHQFFDALPFHSRCHNHMWPLWRPQSWLYGSLSSECQSNVSALQHTV